MIINEHLFNDINELHETLTEHLLAALSKALASNGHAVMAVPGGSTPAPLFQTLAREKFDRAHGPRGLRS